MKTLVLSLVGVLLLSCNHTGKNKQKEVVEVKSTLHEACIAKIMALDHQLGEVRNHACETIPLSETIDKYVDSVNAMNFDSCPKAFERAFKKHASAWLSIKVITDKYPEERGELHELFKRIEAGKDSSVFNVYKKKIWDTWSEVEAAKEK